MISFELDGKVALITGASRGIGEAIATNLAAFGAECILVSRKIEGLEVVRDKIRTAGGKAEAVAGHMGDLTKTEALCEHVKRHYGHLDILVNNAAINPYFGPMSGASPSVYDKTFDVNLRGPFFLIRKAIDLMAERGGSIINIASISGISPGMFQVFVTAACWYNLHRIFCVRMPRGGAGRLHCQPGLPGTGYC